MIVIVEGCGTNINSVQFALERLGQRAIVSADVNVIRSASHVILPGVGTAKQTMSQLKKLNLVDTIRSLQQPVLGICLGMQILYEYSEEGEVQCLGILSGAVKKFPKIPDLIIPHMGWNRLEFVIKNSVLLQGVDVSSYVYYVHGFFASVDAHTVASTEYGISFSGIVQCDNFFGMQFHPERSGKVGEQLLKNFLSCKQHQ